MKKRLFIYNLIIIICIITIFTAISIAVIKHNIFSYAEDTVVNYTSTYASLYKDGADKNLLAQVDDNVRISIISSEGTLLADSLPIDTVAAENHLARPEIQAALNGSPEVCSRYSSTAGSEFIYYAVKVTEGDGYVFIRASIPVASSAVYIKTVTPLFLIILAVTCIAYFIISSYIVKRLMRPLDDIKDSLNDLSNGKYSPNRLGGSYEETHQIIKEIDSINTKLSDNIKILNSEKEKLQYVLQNMTDGLFALDKDNNIVLINNSAMSAFNRSSEILGKNLNYLTFDEGLLSHINEAVNKEQSLIFEEEINNKIYLCTIKAMPGIALTAVFMSDITESKHTRQIREEFFANASHELKTPLTAIKGFNELTAINNKDKSLNKYIEKIDRETSRMLSLISDMLRLSELENARALTPSHIKLGEICTEVRELLADKINAENISVEISGDSTVEAEYKHMYELIKNLFENAVLYNRKNGSVNIRITDKVDHAVLKVSDSGSGISPADQSRIYERFYRADKSRSRKNGGTGLGLSIVKHICNLYGADVTLKSKQGLGTDIIVNIPKHCKT